MGDSTEEELKALARFLEAVVENIPDMIFVKDAKTLLFERFNRAGEELLGWKRAELLGKTDHDFYPKEQADFFHAKDRETLAAKKLVDIPEEPIETKTKGLRWLHTKKVPVLDENGEPLYLLGISEDITARKAAEELAHALEHELAAVVLHAKDAIVTWKTDGQIVSWNPAAETLYGIPMTEAVGKKVDEIVPASARGSFHAAEATLLAGGQLPVASVWRLRRGDEIEVEESLFLLRDKKGEPWRIGSIARDVSELARLRAATEILVGSERLRNREPLEGRGSSAIQEIFSQADVAAADPKATVLILGETGVGKGWLARRIHAKSPRSAKPFFEVNCAGLGPQLVESELFGHERGAFTGATAQKRGLVEVAEGGTLFLDEIGELPMGVQAQILSFLDDRSFRRVGGVRTLKADVRILAATNADLKKEVAAGKFRKDLFYRLSVFPIELPPLRQRREDIPEIVRALLTLMAPSGRRGATVDAKVGKALERHDWPGNVRELRNVLERAMILARGGVIGLEHLPAELRGGDRATAGDERLETVERTHLERVLASVGGNRTHAAERLGISRSTLKRKLAEMGLKEE